ncbi:hypothetical protein GS445_02075 [Rhodococcus hoagii]|uniref:hypothetical protein n=1 Tax=Rhodococcus hoagii TaxID=43767 RepID=UPI001981771E|nr:hypothetical protein [Prescottella equi]MBM4512223.1 hypothetical protein [Prescottella equi]MBM4548544.1 hypothetical protein [Prescottella equi]MBM4710913.1 hypothetical protein [Prescottella equi]NKT29892.1 hypothetical protein [Prescottella equi]NKT99642.1 hypothetical protein [Prescottella equi]
MNDFALETFVRELANQGRATNIAVQHYNEALHGPASVGALEVSDRAFAAAQAILTSAALVSKMLWMSAPKPNPSEEDERQAAQSKERCKTLRRELGIKSIPVLESRRVRNSFEHFDAHLDTFFGDSPNTTVADRNIGPKDMIVIAGAPPRYLRHLDPERHEVSVLSETVSLLEVVQAVEEVAGKANAWLSARGRR